MHLLYVDGSGSVKNPNERHFVLAGIAVFERQIYHLISEVDEFVSSLGLGNPHDIELHGSVMAGGKAQPWKGIVRKARLDIIERSLGLLRGANAKAFAIVVDKQAVWPNDPVEYAFEQICNRFDRYLRRVHRLHGEGQRGLVIMDKSHYEEVLQRLARQFREQGTRWGDLRNLAEIPMFVDSEAARLIQVADLLAWATWRRYEYMDTRYFDQIVSHFDEDNGVIHGLVHFRGDGVNECFCPACLSRPRQRTGTR